VGDLGHTERAGGERPTAFYAYRTMRSWDFRLAMISSMMP